MKKFESKTHYIYAAANFSRSFAIRPTNDIVDEIRTAIRQENKSKFIFLGHEEALLIQSINKIHAVLSVLGDEVKPNDLYFTTSSIDGYRAYNNYCERTGYRDKKITILSCHGFERNAHHGLKGIFEDTDVEPNIVKEKIFLCFNKLNRGHRMWLFEEMLKSDLVKDAFYSFEGDFCYSDVLGLKNFKDKIKESKNEFPNISKIADSLPLRLNITESRTNPVDIIPDDIKYFKNSYFSVVTETVFFDNYTKNSWHKAHVEDSIFFTEKTFKCFPLKHPFILLGRPNCLVELRKAGYKTFSPFIDESYDSVVDNKERFNLIVNEIKRLHSFTPAEWEEWAIGIKEIVDYNHKHFYNRRIVGNYSSTSIAEYFKDVEGCDISKPIYLSDEKPKTMQLVNTKVAKNWNLLTRKLSNDITVTFPIHLDGGGMEMKDELIAAILNTGRKYNKCYEWCCGFGILGYEVYGKGLAENLVFTDYYDIAVKNCLNTAYANGLSDRVKGYVTPAVKNIPEYEKFDLVISNPPHMFSRQCYDDEFRNGPDSFLENTARLLVDDNYGIHKEFFANIRKNLTDDADLFIIESTVPVILKEIIEQNGFYIVEEYDISFGAPNSKTLHIKIRS